MRPARRATTLVVAVLVGACSTDPTGVLSDRESMDAAAEFTRLADSLSAAGADAPLGAGYRALADVARGGGAIAPIVISVDGVPAEYAALVREIALEPTGVCATPGAPCLMAPPLRTMVAWQRGNPRRVVQVIGERGWMSGASTFPDLLPGVSTLTYLDGAGAVFVGSGGAPSISDLVVSDTPCWNETLPTISQRVTCRRAQLTVSFSGMASVPPGVRQTAANGTHDLAMTSQRVAGARILLGPSLGGPSVPPAYLPPISLRGPVLPATIGAAVAPSGVTFTLTIANAGAAPAELHFSSGQQFDFRVRRADGTSAWVWSAGMGFITALTSRLLAPGERIEYTATWSTAASGSYVVDGVLTSTSHQAGATAAFVVP